VHVEVGVLEAGLEQDGAVLVDGDRARDAARPRVELLLRRGIERLELNHVGDGEQPTGPQHTERFSDDSALVFGQVDDAVRDHDVYGRVGKRDVFDRAFEKRGIAHIRPVAIGVRERQHLVGHVEAVRVAARRDALRREQHVQAGARSKVEHDLPRL